MLAGSVRVAWFISSIRYSPTQICRNWFNIVILDVIVTAGRMANKLLFLLWGLLWVVPAISVAGPTTFEPVIGTALLCRDQIDPIYFKDYLIRFFKNPYKTEGEAYWFKPDSGQKLYDMALEDIFVSTEGSRYAFLGVVFKENLTVAKKKMLETKGMSYLPFSGETVLRSAQGGFLIEYNTTQSKLYCVKHRTEQ